MIWSISNRADPFAREIADRHYNRQKIGAPQFVPPGRCCVLKAETETGRAFWVTSFPFAEYVKHAWAGAWVCSAFRNEGVGVASELISDALAATRFHFGDPPELGMITFLDRTKVRPVVRRSRKTWGDTWIRAGFSHVGETRGGLMAFQILPENIPPAEAAIGSGLKLIP
jgi:hypothetical protein